MPYFSFQTLRRYWTEPEGYADVLRIGLPLVVSMASTTVMQFTDRLFLSHYSLDAIAAALPAGLAVILFVLSCAGITGYATVLIAQNLGAAKPERVGLVLWQAIWLSLIFGGAIAFLSTFAEPIFAFSGHSEALQELECTYFTVLCTGAVFPILVSAMSGFFSGLGRTRSVMLANFVAMIINVPLDYLLIYGKCGFPELGIMGAGIATVFGSAVTMVMLAIGIFRHENEMLYRVRSSMVWHWQTMKLLLRYGTPSGGNFFVELFAFTWFSFVVGSMGSAPLTATNIAFSFHSIAFMPTLGLNVAVSSMVGNAMGAHEPARAERATSRTLHITMIWMVGVGCTFLGAPALLVDLFLPASLSLEDYTIVHTMTCTLLIFITTYCLFDSFTVVYGGALKGAGDTTFIMVNMTLNGLFSLIIPAYIFKAFGWWNVYLLWTLLTWYGFTLALCFYRRYRRGAWKALRILEN